MQGRSHTRTLMIEHTWPQRCMSSSPLSRTAVKPSWRCAACHQLSACHRLCTARSAASRQHGANKCMWLMSQQRTPYL